LWFALFLACVDPDAAHVSDDTDATVFEVPAGATANGIGDRLIADGFVDSKLTWKMFLRGRDLSCLKAGKFSVRKQMSLNQLADTLCGPPLAEDEPFTVIEGWRIRDIDAALVAKGWIKPGEYTDLAMKKGVDLPFAVPSPTLEGYLYPETYRIEPKKFSAKGLIERQLTTFQARFLTAHQAEVDAGRGLHAIVVMASMLEREEPKPTQRPITAGILWKRIDGGWALGVDATSRYELAEWNDRDAFMKHLRDPDDVYNTRLRTGLPPTAIGNPTVNALESALRPVASEWWYYLHDKQQVFHGGKNAEEHEANRKKYDIW